MSARRKISIRKIVQTIVTLLAVSGCAVAMIAADRQHTARLVKDVELKVKTPAGVRFVTETAIRNMLFTGRHILPTSLNLRKVDERSMEAILRANPWVERAQVYVDAERVMHIILTQRVPVVRIFEEDGNSYYLDTALKAMPLSAQYTHYAPVVTGVPKLLSDSSSVAIKGTIVGLVRSIQSDTFWSAQVSQINMRSDGGFELIPVLGKQVIILGDTTRLHDKLDALFSFYTQIQNKVGWDKYNTLDLRYQDQVVASPSLPWKAPVDRALTNMNWLKAIMENAPLRQGQLGGDASAIADSSTKTNQQPAANPKPATTNTPKAPTVALATSGTKPTRSQSTSQPVKPKSSGPLQAAGGSPKARLSTVVNKNKPQPKKNSPGNTTHHKQNTPPHAATNR